MTRSPKVRLVVAHPSATIYLNLEEAGLLCHHEFADALDAARALIVRGAHRVSVTNGGAKAAFGGPDGIISATPPEVLVTRVTGAGDTFMAAHIAADLDGADATQSLLSALQAAANYVSGDTPL